MRLHRHLESKRKIESLMKHCEKCFHCNMNSPLKWDIYPGYPKIVVHQYLHQTRSRKL